MIRSLKSPHSVLGVHILRIIAKELFDNVFELFLQIKAQYGEKDERDRPLEEMVGSQMAVSENFRSAAAPVSRLIRTRHFVSTVAACLYLTSSSSLGVSIRSTPSPYQPY